LNLALCADLTALLASSVQRSATNNIGSESTRNPKLVTRNGITFNFKAFTGEMKGKGKIVEPNTTVGLH
jgi:hypothetical protein